MKTKAATTSLRDAFKPRYRALPGHICAYCTRDGVIGFTSPKRRILVPEGSLPIACGSPKRLREVITATSRIAYDGKTLLVPGLPEADMLKLDPVKVLLDHTSWVLKRDGLYKAIQCYAPMPNDRGGRRAA
jgi:hypothetical protein